MMRVRAIIILVVVFGFCASFAISPAAAGVCDEAVEVSSGLVRGQADAETATCGYKGIPFAAPPVGELRFRAPRPPSRWEGVFEADAFGDRCMQKGTMALVDKGQDLGMSEDCLYLNVWRPAKSGVFPVMVWIHGGGYTGGTGSTEMYWGDRLSETGDVVVVSINYRLNVFGFMALPALRAEDENDSVGSYGSLDQVAALGWVQENIAGFGGDPDNVTIFGESAGGWSVCTMMATPLNKGVFHRAILESGGCESSSSVETGYEQGRKVMGNLGCAADDLECLRAVDAETLLDQTGSQLDGFVWVPRHDGYLLADSPLKTIQAGRHNKTPFMAGSNRDEVDVLLKLVPQFKYMTKRSYQKKMKKYLGVTESEAERLAELYPPDEYGKPVDAFGQMMTDAGLGCPTYNGMAEVSTHDPPVYYYRFDYDEMKMGKTIGAVHAMEMPFVFNSMDRKPISLLYGPKRIERASELTRVMQGYWVNFARHGDPNGKGLPAWPEFALDAPHVQALDQPVRTEAAEMEDRCEFWLDYNQKYGPIFENLHGFVE